MALYQNNDVNVSKLVKEYLDRFPYVYNIKKDSEHYENIEKWCRVHCGSEYKDWFWHQGGRYDDYAILHITSEKINTIFVLKWGDKCMQRIKK